MVRICFQIELAHWYYIDFCRQDDPELPACGMKAFMAISILFVYKLNQKHFLIVSFQGDFLVLYSCEACITNAVEQVSSSPDNIGLLVRLPQVIPCNILATNLTRCHCFQRRFSTVFLSPQQFSVVALSLSPFCTLVYKFANNTKYTESKKIHWLVHFFQNMN